MLPASLSPGPANRFQHVRETDSIYTSTVGPMPAHWKLSNLPPVLRFLFKSLCMVGVGQTDLDDVWESCKSEDAFDLSRQKLNQRITTVTVVVRDRLSELSSMVLTCIGRADHRRFSRVHHHRTSGGLTDRLQYPRCLHTIVSRIWSYARRIDRGFRGYLCSHTNETVVVLTGQSTNV